jgi:hypothetical protein
MEHDLDRAVRDILQLTEPLFHIPAGRRHGGDPEVREILEGTTAGQMERFYERWGCRPDEIVSRLLEEFLRSKGEQRFTVEPRPLLQDGRVDTDVGARVCLKGVDPKRLPFLYIYIGTPVPPVRRAVEFGLRFGPLVEDTDPCVHTLNQAEVRELTDRALAGNIDMTSVYGSDLDLEGDDDAHITSEPRWGRRAAFTVGYGGKDLPADLSAKVIEALESLWEPFLRSSMA